MMQNEKPNRTYALELLHRYNTSESLIRHALTVEAVMVHFAELFHEDTEKWGIIGLIHDIDYEKYPDQHCIKAREILTLEQWPDNYIHAVESHGWKLVVDVKPEEKMEIVLYTIDELTGLLTAAALLRPSKSILDLTVPSIKKKWKQKGFAAGVNRLVVEEGVAMLGMDLEQVMDETLKGMQTAAEAIGLKGFL